MEFEKFYKLVSKNDVIKFQKQHKLNPFPSDYIDFLTQYNGGVPDNVIYRVSGCDSLSSSMVSFFYSIDPSDFDSNEVDTLSYALKTFLGSIPKNVLPIASDEIGNLICLNLEKGRNQNKIYVWVHDFPAEDKSWKNMFTIANDLQSFIESLEYSDVNDYEIDELELVCIDGDLVRLKKALDKGIPIEKINNIASICASYDHIELLELLHEYGYSLKDPTILRSAFYEKVDKIILYLLNLNDSFCEILENGSTWLHSAAKYNNAEVAKILIEKGCPVQQKNNNGSTAMREALVNRSDEVAKIIRKQIDQMK